MTAVMMTACGMLLSGFFYTPIVIFILARYYGVPTEPAEIRARLKIIAVAFGLTVVLSLVAIFILLASFAFLMY